MIHAYFIANTIAANGIFAVIGIVANGAGSVIA